MAEIDNLKLAIGEKLSPAFRSITERATEWLEINGNIISSAAGQWWAVLGERVSFVSDAFSRLWANAQPALMAWRTRRRS